MIALSRELKLKLRKDSEFLLSEKGSWLLRRKHIFNPGLWYAMLSHHPVPAPRHRPGLLPQVSFDNIGGVSQSGVKLLWNTNREILRSGKVVKTSDCFPHFFFCKATGGKILPCSLYYLINALAPPVLLPFILVFIAAHSLVDQIWNIFQGKRIFHYRWVKGHPAHLA